MKTLLLLTAAAVGLTACQDGVVAPSSAPDAQLSAAGAESELIPGQYIVVFKGDVQDAPGLARRLAAAQGASVRFTYQHAIKGFAANMSDRAALALTRNPNVAYVEQDGVARASATTVSAASWGLDRIDHRTGLDRFYTYTNDGTGVTVYIIDTGIEIGHSEFEGRASYGRDVFTGSDFTGGADCDGHGTHVAGTVGGKTYGVARNVSLVAVRVLNCSGSGTWSGVIAGMDWVAANHTARAVANMSLGGGKSQAVNDAAERLIAAGVTTAVAAGNGNMAGIPQDACNQSPASAPNAITVGSTTSSDTESSFSNYGSCVDILAPGSSITSAKLGGGSVAYSGTSMASPHVAGVAALYLQNGAAPPQTVRNALVNNASVGEITLHRNSKRNGTPNRLLFTTY